MLGSDLVKEAMKEFEKEREGGKKAYEEIITYAGELHESRIKAVDLLGKVENYAHNIYSYGSEETEEKINKIISNLITFNNTVENFKRDQEIKSDVDGDTSGIGGVAGAGILSGIGIAALGPTAALAFATTFGVSTTGTAIASLTGVAATKAALAYIGGGAIAAGGGGIVAGKALLGFLGPIGLGIGGISLVAGIIKAKIKNEDKVKEIEKAIQQIKDEKDNLENIWGEMRKLKRKITKSTRKIYQILEKIDDNNVEDFQAMVIEGVELSQLVNDVI